ncbi:hypothetical protein JA1_003598 [Spathaspora sp. JA1]|nr:hypothetical protein JA1_003598 [Spathaspora sp. JA1]
MVFMIPISVKIAITLGAVVGASVAIIHNKETILETAEHIFEQGAEFCRNKLNEAKHRANEVQFADAYEDFSFSRSDEDGSIDEKIDEKSSGRSTGVKRSTGSSLVDESDYSEISTPEISDYSEMSEFSEIDDNDYLEDGDSD